MADMSFKIASKELKIALIVQSDHPFRLLHLLQIYGHGFYELSRALMRKMYTMTSENIRPFERTYSTFSERVGDIHDGEEASVFAMS